MDKMTLQTKDSKELVAGDVRVMLCAALCGVASCARIKRMGAQARVFSGVFRRVRVQACERTPRTACI